ncbi:hypothetical protein PQR71_14010 [Paraburkholderia fungorum]|uniref:hypothetical protein n=1 Tax=Paraburkholderia fungorum TaxID=134537 RepID=UPI0038B96AB1
MGCGTLTLGAIGFIVVVSVIGGMVGGNKSDDAKSAPAAEEACQKDDLSCLGNKGVVGAGVYCQDPIERLAKHSVKWTDGTFEKNGVITYIGDKAEFQNGFEAFTPVTYECDLASDGKTVLDARVSEGRLPK